MIYDEEWERKRKERVKRLRERFRSWFNVDNLIDATVDLFLILFDVLASPILIVMRLARYMIGKYMLDGVKNKIKKVAHWTEDKHIAIKIIVWILLIFVGVIILTLMWLIGSAFTDFVMDEWGHQALNLDE
jgi:hypothetical protein